MYDNASVRSTRNDEKHIKYAMKALDKIYIIYTCYRLPHMMSSDQKHNTNIAQKVHCYTHTMFIVNKVTSVVDHKCRHTLSITWIAEMVLLQNWYQSVHSLPCIWRV